jgi:16S rRNA (cytosine1402-N4)-methyltransferase
VVLRRRRGGMNRRLGPVHHGRAPWTMCSPSIGTVEDSSSALFPADRSGRVPCGVRPVGGLQMAQDFLHDPVMAPEVTALFDTVPTGIVIDCTVGGGGHSEAVLRRDDRLRIVGIDRDPQALVAAGRRLASFGDRVELRHARFGELRTLLSEIGTAAAPIVGVLFDLGVSSPQLDQSSRGFSYRNAGPLDMRMDPTSGIAARDLVNEADVDRLAALFAANGEARFARRIANAVVAARPLETTTDLAAVVERAIPAAARRRGHPARRVFQALRIEVNDELKELADGLSAALDALAIRGRCVVIAYHSGEDRMVKQTFADAVSGGCICPPQLPCVCGARRDFQLVFRGSRRASFEEVATNRRAESGRLRAIERVGMSAALGATEPTPKERAPR